MCGIAGILRFDGQPVGDADLSRILDPIRHRGKDSCAFVKGSRGSGGGAVSRSAEIGLGHRRLSIIDLSPEAAQPMSYDGGRLWITYNGELYNYIELREELRRAGRAFRTASDTEVVAAAYSQWGRGCLARFDGMFAFALWDEARRELFCARDPMGIKPFHYVRTPECFAFASESAALRHLTDGSLDPDAVAAYFLFMYVPGPWSIFRGIRKLQPGHFMIVAPRGAEPAERYWGLGEIADLEDTPERRGGMEGLLKGAVKRQLRSDVPVGAFLSGGIDSSLVVSLAADETADFHTFSVGYEGQEENELSRARFVAQRFGTRHHELFLRVSDVMENLDRALEASSEPVADSAIVPTYMLSRMAAEAGVKVLLNGTGGDEVFGGYHRYVAGTVKRRLYDLLPRTLQRTLGRVSRRHADPTWAARFSHIGFDMAVGTGGSASLARRLFPTEEAYAAFLGRLVRECFPGEREDAPPLYNKMLFDMQVYLVDELLTLLDQMTMAWTIEGRVPLLDVALVRESFRFPPASHVHRGRTKILMRDLARARLGETIADRPKQGFGGPVGFWVERFADRMLEGIEPVLKSPGLDRLSLEPYRRGIGDGRLGEGQKYEMFYLYCFQRWRHGLEGKGI